MKMDESIEKERIIYSKVTKSVEKFSFNVSLNNS